jgi:type I restriction enzyme R subunit
MPVFPARGTRTRRAAIAGLSPRSMTTLCLIPDSVLHFICASQLKEWDKFTKQYGAEAKDRLLKRLASEVKTRGTLEVLRKGIKSDGCSFRLVYFRPSSGLNEEAKKLYEANLFAVVR